MSLRATAGPRAHLLTRPRRAVLLKVNVDGDSSASYFAFIVGSLTVLPIVLPIAMRLYVRLGGFGSGARDLKRVWGDAQS